MTREKRLITTIELGGRVFGASGKPYGLTKPSRKPKFFARDVSAV
jgi:hypothetical protein